MLSQDGSTIRAYWKPNGRVNVEHQRKIEHTMRECGVRTLSITYFLYNKTHQKKHSAVAKALKLKK
jgi:hypothetical protein